MEPGDSVEAVVVIVVEVVVAGVAKVVVQLVVSGTVEVAVDILAEATGGQGQNEKLGSIGPDAAISTVHF